MISKLDNCEQNSNSKRFYILSIQIEAVKQTFHVELFLFISLLTKNKFENSKSGHSGSLGGLSQS